MVALLIAVALTKPQVRPAEERPNIVVVFLDDAGYGDFEHNGNPVIETPTIARMAREGANFTQFYTTSAACTASRYSLLTGRYPKRSGFPSWVLDPGSPQHLATSETTLAEALKAKGYATAMFGKWHLGTPNDRNGQTPDALPLAHGFDRWLGTDVSHDYNTSRLMESDGNAGYRTIASGLTSQPEVCASLTERYADGAIAFARENRDKPFFVYLAPNMPHLGLFVSKAFAGRSRRGLLGDVMAELDHHLGRLWKTVEDLGLAKNTLILVTSDNGPWIRFQNTASDPKYGEARMHVGYAQPFRDGKGSSWEGGHRVPGVIYWPGTIRPGQRLDPMSTLDVLPTLAGLAGARVGPVDGRDMRRTMLTGESPAEPFELVYSGPDNQGWAIRQGPWKLHIRIGSQTGNSYGFAASREKPLLFQVEQDLGERFDRAAEQPAIRDRLLGRLAAWERG